MSDIELVTQPPGLQQRVLVVEFRSLDGRTCVAIGGGPTNAEAIAFARESCPTGEEWQAVGSNDLYGE